METAYMIGEELERARAKHPEANFLALAEEVGEVAKAILEGQNNHAKYELVQVATVAIRLIEEGIK